KKQALVLPLILFAVTDILIGFHNTMIFTWGSMLLVVGIGLWLKQHKRMMTIFASSLASAVLFFVISNLGVWYVGELYTVDAAGLKECFIMALPFFKMELLSTLIYTAVFFGSYEMIAARIRSKGLARAL